MRAVYALVFVLGGAALADDKADPEPLKAVAGDGVLVAFEGKGLKLTKAEMRKFSYARRDAVVTGDTITAEFGGKKETVTYKVDNTKNPPHIDLTFTRDGKTETERGIYKVEKNVLTICAVETNLHGNFEVVEIWDGGKREEKPELKSVAIEANEVALKLNKDAVWKFSLNPSQKSAPIDLTMGDTKAPGIYKVEETDTGTELTVAFRPNPKAERPKDFSGEDKENVVLKLLRSPARPTEFKAGRDPKTVRDHYLLTIRKRHELEAPYLLVGFAAKGFTLGEDQLKKVPPAERTLIIDDEEIVLMFDGKELTGTFKVDNTQTPHHINLSLTRDGKTETSSGIYKFEKGVLTICASSKGELSARPKEFKSPDDQTTVFVLQQQPRK